MNKSELIDKIAEASKDAKLSKTKIEWVVNQMLSVIRSTVKKQDVLLLKFGRFTKSKRKARMGRHPKTGKTFKIAARTVPRFKAGKEFKKAVR